MRRRWLAVTGLVLMVGSIGLLFLIKPPAASAQTLPPEIISYEVTCETLSNNTKTVAYPLKFKNPNTVAVAYTIVRHWDDGRPDVVPGPRNVNGGAEATVPYSNATNVDKPWTHTLTIKVGETVVAGPITKTNPCLTPTVPPEVTYDVTCQKTAAGVAEAVVYNASIKNPNTVAQTYTLVRHWDDSRPDVVTENVVVAAGATVSGAAVNHSSPAGLAAQWTHTLTIKVGATVVGAPITKQNPCYTAPTPPGPPVVTYDVTCQKTTAGVAEAVLYAPTIKNPNTVAAKYTMVINWSDGRKEVTSKEVEVAAGATVSGESVNYTDKAGLTEEWTNTLTVKEGGKAVGTPITKQNPCYTAPTDPTTTTSTSVTTTTDIAAAAATSGGGSGLATTGVGIAVAVIAGVGLLLFANGAGLLRLVRRGEHE